MVIRRSSKPAKSAQGRLATSPEERTVIDGAFATLSGLGIEASVDAQLSSNKPADYLGSLRRGSKRASCQIEVKRSLRPTTLGPLLLRLKGVKPSPLLLADYVTPQVAKLLRDNDIAFADTAGNAYLKLAGDVFYVVGQTPERRPKAESVVRAFQPTGLRVVFALLCDPELISLPTRQLAARLNVANGTVSRVVDDLIRLGFASITGRRDRRLHNTKGLLERWVMMYPAQLRPGLLRRKLSTDQADWWVNEQFDARHVALGGEAAADRLTGSIKPGQLTLYARGQPRPLNEIVARHRLRTDPNGNVEVLDAFWPADIAIDQAGLAPTLLIYADLLVTGNSRSLEAARRIYDEYLAGRFKTS